MPMPYHVDRARLKAVLTAKEQRQSLKHAYNACCARVTHETDSVSGCVRRKPCYVYQQDTFFLWCGYL